ncbi:MAG: DUF3443 domain-containing protein [Candidatus Competibacter denitrificans]
MRLFGFLVLISGVVLGVGCGGGGGGDSGTTPTGVTSVRVTCTPATVRSGGTSHCSAAVAGSGNYSTAVNWATSAGSIAASGVLTAPLVSSITPVTVTATSTQDSSRSGSATVTVNPAGSAQNVHPIVVDGGPPGLGADYYVNGLFTSVRVCEPGSTSRCQTIDHVLVDTGAVGVRMLSAAAGGQLGLSLPAHTASDGNPLVQCMQFLDGFTWGPIALADIYLGDQLASSVPIQVIAPADAPAVPSSCRNTGGSNENTLSRLGANGILGIGLFLEDCGDSCAQQALNVYYSCSTSSCVETAVPTARQVQNPVAMFSNDNNGLIVQLPSIANAGQESVTGSLVFGIGTQPNNGLGNAAVYTTDARGNFTATYNGASYSSSFIDSGSNGIFFLSAAVTGLPACQGIYSGFYCPATETTFTVTNTGRNGVSGAVTFSVANAQTLIDSKRKAFNNLAGVLAGRFDYGLPFFFGRNVYVAIEGRNTPGGVGPYWAY